MSNSKNVCIDWFELISLIGFELTEVFLPIRYHLKDVIVGKIYFLLVRIKIQHMELQLIKKEMTGIGMDSFCV